MVSSSSVGYDVAVPIRFAARYLPASAEAIGMWVARGYLAKDEETGETVRKRIEPVGRDRRGRLYRYGDLVAAEKATREQPSRSHRKPRVIDGTGFAERAA